MAKRLGSYALFAAGLFALAPAASAQVLDIGAGLNGEVNVGQVRATTSTGTNVNVNINARSTSSPTGLSATSSTTGTATVTGQSGVQSGTATSADSRIDITRSDVDDAQYSSMDSGEVTTSAELGTYVGAMMQEDENVSRVSAGDQSVSLWYKDRARLLGFIPVTVSAEARVSADGSVEVSYPWYGFLTTYNSGSLESDLDVTAGSIARAEGTTSLSAAAQARILDAVRIAMREHYESNLEANGNADASGQIEIE